MGIIDTEYDEAKVMRLFKKEAYKEGLQIGEQKGIQIGEQKGRAEEKKNTDRERRRADSYREQLIAAGITPVD